MTTTWTEGFEVGDRIAYLVGDSEHIGYVTEVHPNHLRVGRTVTARVVGTQEAALGLGRGRSVTSRVTAERFLGMA